MWYDHHVYTFAGLAIIVLLLTIRGWGDVIYYLTSHWREAMLIAICGLTGVLLAMHKGTIGYSLGRGVNNIYTMVAAEPDEYKVMATINQCKSFLTAKLHDRTTEVQPQLIEAGLIPLRHSDSWEICARTFGMNYWKHDISIQGRNGGHVLCEAYTRENAENTVSGKVKAWCETVFAPGRPI